MGIPKVHLIRDAGGVVGADATGVFTADGRHFDLDVSLIIAVLRSAEVTVQLRQALTGAIHGGEERPNRPETREGAGNGILPFQGGGRSLGEC